MGLVASRSAARWGPPRWKKQKLESGSGMTIEPGGVFEEGEELILATEAREARASAFSASLKHRSAVVSEFLTVLVFGALAFTGTGGVPLHLILIAIVVLGSFEFLRRRARSEFERAQAVADELAEAVSALDRPSGHPTT